MTSLTDFKGDSISLTKIGDEAFTVTYIEKSVYNDPKHGDKPSVKITVDPGFEIEGTVYTKFHTTRQALVTTLTRAEVMKAVNEDENPLGPVKCVETQSTKSVNKYFKLVDVKPGESPNEE